MLQLPSHLTVRNHYAYPQEDEQSVPSFGDAQRLFAAARRQIVVFCVFLVLALSLGGAYLVTVKPQYTADAFILIDNRRIRAVESSYADDPSSSVADAAALLVDSQVEVIKSERIAARVIRTLNLLDDPQFKAVNSPQRSLIKSLRRFVMPPFGSDESASHTPQVSTSSEEARFHRIVEALGRNMIAGRVARTMVLRISYTSPDREKAAQIANAYAEAYLADQLDAKFEATKRASEWLEDRIADLKKKALSSDLAIQKFREEHGLILSGGRLVNEQQLTEINTQLVAARGDTAKAEARYQRIEAIIEGHHTDSIVSEALGNVVIEQLRTKYLEASKRHAEMLAKLGKDHQAVIGLQTEMSEYEKLMFAELGRVAESYRSELEIAKTRETSLKADLDRIVNLNAIQNKDLVTLHELEREGETYRSLHETYLKRYNEALQQQSFPIIEARVLTAATAPLAPSYPKKAIILLLFGIGGGAFGAAIGLMRELREKGFQSEDQVKSNLGLECLGILPEITLKQPATAEATQAEPTETAVDEPNRINPKYIPANSGIFSYASIRPGSIFVETLMATKLAADVMLTDHHSKVIGTVSVLPGEGKSVFSKNFATLLAHLGKKTLLIDGDLRRARLTLGVASKASKGIVEAVIYKDPVDNLIMLEKSSGLSVLPCVIPQGMTHTSEFLASAGMQQLLSEAKKQYDYIVLDLPPLGPVLDARAIAPQLDAFVFIVEWRRTARKIVRNVLLKNEDLCPKCLGIVINKVNMGELRLYEGAGSHYRHYHEYAKSYYTQGEEDMTSTSWASRWFAKRR
jgi:succinoglycan biosynthesis transport protein ExoP